MFRTNTLAACWMALIPIASVPLLCAQSQAPKAHSASIFNGSHSYLGIGVRDDMTDERAKSLGVSGGKGNWA